MKKIRNKILLVLLLIIICLATIKRKNIWRVYKTVTLFEEENIVNNFWNMHHIFPTKQMDAAINPYDFEKTSSGNIVFGKNGISGIDSFLQKMSTDAMIVLVKDTILYEYYTKPYHRDNLHISWSVCKSIISCLVGIAYEDGLIEDIDDPVEKYVESLAESGYEGVSIRQLLQMQSGIRFDEDYNDFNSDINRLGRVFAFGTSFDKYVGTLEREYTPGMRNKYVSMDTQVLGMLLVNITGQSIAEYCQDKLWQPMGAEHEAHWIIDNKGMEAAFGGLVASPLDFAKFGNLYAHEGNVGGKQIISKDWIVSSWIMDDEADPTDRMEDEELDMIANSHELGYGYQWWLAGKNSSDYMAMGIYNQFIFVNPVCDLVIVKLSSNVDFAEDKIRTRDEHITFFKRLKHLVCS